MERVEEFLDWLVALDVQHYKTECSINYTPSVSHFYLSGSHERFSSAEIISIWSNTASSELNERWLYAVSIAETNK
jgi:hypothetical protein